MTIYIGTNSHSWTHLFRCQPTSFIYIKKKPIYVGHPNITLLDDIGISLIQIIMKPSTPIFTNALKPSITPRSQTPSLYGSDVLLHTLVRACICTVLVYQGLVVSSWKLQYGMLTDFFLFFSEENSSMISKRQNLQVLFHVLFHNFWLKKTQ